VKKSMQFISLLITLLLFSGCTLSQQPNQTVQVDQFVPPGAEPAMAAAQSGTIIKVQASAANVKVGETVNVEIVIENVANLIGADIELKFDAAILKAQDADPAKNGVQIKPGAFLSPDFVIMNGIDNATGIAQYALTQLPSSPAANGTGVIASITFEALTNGTANLSLTKADLPSSEAKPIAATLVNGQVIVGDGGGTQPTAIPPTAVQPTAVPPTAAPPTAIPPTTVPPTAAPPTAIPPTVGPGTPLPPTPIPPTSQPPTVAPPTPIVTPGTEPTEPPPPPEVDNYAPDGVTVGFCYRVQPGDTLYGLGDRFGIDFRDIGLANALWPPDHIFVNQALFIPEQMGHGPNFYITRDGDTLAGIAEQCHLPVDFLARRNGYDVTDSVAPGEVMFIPIPPFAPPSRPAPMRNAPCCASCMNDYPLPYAGPCNY